MKKIKNLLKKFQKVISLEEENKKIIIEAIKKYTQEDLKDKDLKISNKTIYISQNPYVKREILLKKSKILAELKEKLINLVIKDIK